MASLILGGWFLSAIALLTGIVILVSHVATGSAERAWRFMCVAVFLAVFAMQISEQLVLSPNEGPPVMTALFNTIQTIILQLDAPSMTDEIKELLGSLAKPYVTYSVLVSLAAPATTVGSALIAFSRIMSLPLLWLRSCSSKGGSILSPHISVTCCRCSSSSLRCPYAARRASRICGEC